MPGSSADYVDQTIREKRLIEPSVGELAVDMARPTFIKVKRIHLNPETLDHYALSWEICQVL